MENSKAHVLPRLFIERDWLEGDKILLPPEARHYLVNVLRLRPEGTFTAILDGQVEMEAVLEEVTPTAEARIVARNPVPEERGPCITLLQAQLKGQKMAWLVQKATELGTNRLIIVTTERAIPRPRETRETLERWKTIAREAAEQCGATRLPKLEGPLPFPQALAACQGEGLPAVGRPKAGLRLLLWEGEAPHLRDILGQMSVGEPLCGLPDGGRGQGPAPTFTRRNNDVGKAPCGLPNGGRRQAHFAEVASATKAESVAPTQLPNSQTGPANPPVGEALCGLPKNGRRQSVAPTQLPNSQTGPANPPVGEALCGLANVFLVVGPEGGFTPAEVEMAQAAGFTPASLGSRTLRAETAALAALAVLRFALGSNSRPTLDPSGRQTP